MSNFFGGSYECKIIITIMFVKMLCSGSFISFLVFKHYFDLMFCDIYKSKC